MFKCEFCGKEFSPKILNIHQDRCLENPKNNVKEAKEVKKESKKGAK